MSDITLPYENSTAVEDHPAKRQRVITQFDPAMRYSSPDELAASSDYELSRSRRASRNVKLDIHERQQQSYGDSDDPDESPDELDHTVHTFYRDHRSESTRISTNSPAEIGVLMETAQKESTPPREPVPVLYKQKLVLKGHKKGVAAVKFSPDGLRIASCSADATIKIWDAVSGKHMQTLEGHMAGVSTIAWSPDSKTLASGSDDKSIRLWDVHTGKPYPVPLLGHHNYIYSIAFSPKGNMLVSGSYDEAVFLWDVRAARVMRSLPAHSDPVGGVDFIRDGTLIVSCAGDGLIRIWDTATGQCLRTLVHEDNAPVVSVRFSPNGKFVLAWTLDSCVRLWNYVEGRCLKTYQGHKNERYSIGGAFGVHGDDAFVVSGSEDASMVIWDVTSKHVLQRLEGHDGVVLGVDTHPSENSLVSGGLDRTVRVWKNHEASEVDAVVQGNLPLE
ncbi:MAG: WD domain protein [Candelina mexicana]|nr:MAG: WD domain protein [Candelina mexicana]